MSVRVKVKGTSYFGVWILRKAFFTSCVDLHEQRGERVTIAYWDYLDSSSASTHSPSLPLRAGYVSPFDLRVAVWLALPDLMLTWACTVCCPFLLPSDPLWKHAPGSHCPRPKPGSQMRNVEQRHLHRAVNMRIILFMWRWVAGSLLCSISVALAD